MVHLIYAALAVFGVSIVVADDPHRFYTWTVTYGSVAPLGVPQQVGFWIFNPYNSCCLVQNIHEEWGLLMSFSTEAAQSFIYCQLHIELPIYADRSVTDSEGL